MKFKLSLVAQIHVKIMPLVLMLPTISAVIVHQATLVISVNVNSTHVNIKFVKIKEHVFYLAITQQNAFAQVTLLAIVAKLK